MIDKIISLSEEFISIKSIPENPAELKRVLNRALDELDSFTIEKFEREGSHSALIFTGKSRPEKFKVILNGHLDVVPGKDFQYTPKVDGDKLYGVGALDMKSNLACMIYAFKEVASQVNYPLGLQIVTDEELGGFNGTQYQVEQGVRSDFVIAGETTNFDIVHEAKGILWLRISCTGKTAHGAYPWNGDNAVTKMSRFLTLLEREFPNPDHNQWKTTINVSNIKSSNTSFNKIPDDCEVWLDIRYIPEDEDVIVEMLKKLLPKDFSMNIDVKEPSTFVDPHNPYIQKLIGITREVADNESTTYGANGSSDVRHYARVGGHGIEFGPIGGGIGSDHEWTSIAGLESYYMVLKKFLLSI